MVGSGRFTETEVMEGGKERQCVVLGKNEQLQKK